MARTETYLDWNATAPLRAEAAAAVAAALARCGNPSSVHRWGRAARAEVEHARAAVAALVRAPDRGVVFVSGGTEANHLALLGADRARVLVSAVEHDSVLRVLPEAQPIPVDGDGLVRLDTLADLLAADPRPALVSVMLANNETGVIQPARRDRGHRPCPRRALSLRRGSGCRQDPDRRREPRRRSRHPLGAQARRTPGVGALVVTGELDLLPMLHGGGQERGRRAGTENLPGIAGFAAAAGAAVAELAIYDHVRALREALEAEIAAVAPDALVLGAAVPRLPNTSAVAMPGTAAETQIIALDLDGVMVSAGAACSSGKVGPSHVLKAMRVPPDLAAATIRVSLGWSTTEADIGRFLDAWTALYRRRRGFVTAAAHTQPAAHKGKAHAA